MDIFAAFNGQVKRRFPLLRNIRFMGKIWNGTKLNVSTEIRIISDQKTNRALEKFIDFGFLSFSLIVVFRTFPLLLVEVE